MALGLVCDGASTGCRPCSHQLGLSYFLTTPVDGARFMHLYDINLQLKGVSKPVPSSWLSSCTQASFSQIASYQNLTFAVISNLIVVFHRLIPYTLWNEHTSAITSMLIVGKHLVTVDEDGNLLTWELPHGAKDLPSKSPVVLSRVFLPPDFVVSCIVHPHTYINKVLLAARDGRTLLLNLSSRKIIHIFNAFPSPITVMEPSPIADVVAVGTQDGTVCLHNFRTDKTVFSFRLNPSSTSKQHQQDQHMSNESNHAVRAISFRTDGVETLATADAVGNLFIWDLNEKRLSSEARHVHPNGVIFAEFLPGEPILVTTGSVDNAVKVHIFDDSKENVRLLRSREGHYLPPNKVRFCGFDGLTMVSAGLDRELRLVCAVRESRNRPFSQNTVDKRGRTAKKTARRRENVEVGDRSTDFHRCLPPVVDISSSNTRAKDSEFANIVTVHEGMREAYSWRMTKGASHKHVLKPPPRPSNLELSFKRQQDEPIKKKSKVELRERVVNHEAGTCVEISPCGNYAFVGFSDGRLHSFNLQSGLHQGVFDAADALISGQNLSSEWGVAHDGSVKSLSVDGCGELLASAGSSDGLIKFWELQTRKTNGSHIVTSGNVTKMVWCETSDLLGAAMEDFSVHVFDVPTRKIARSFKGHEGSIVDICFDCNGRRLVTASMDGSIRTWDLPSGSMFNVLRCVDPPTSVAVCPNGEFLASTHVNSLSIRLWVNCERFGGKQADLKSWLHSFDGVIDFDDDDQTVAEDESWHETEKTEKEKTGGNSDVMLSDDILTLSCRPSNVWTVLTHLKEIQERNKPVEPVQKGKNAPFFLPTVKGVKFQFDTSAANNDEHEEIESQIGKGGGENDGHEMSQFGKLLQDDKWLEASKLLNEGDASTVDNELRSLSEQSSIQLCAKYLIDALSKSSCFELTQAHLHVFLSCHGGALAGDEEGEELLHELLEKQKQAWRRLRSCFTSVSCLSSFFSGQV